MKKCLLIVAVYMAMASAPMMQAAEPASKDEIVYATGADVLPDSLIDTPRNVELKEVTVSGSTIIRKADKKLMIPTASQIKNAKSGIQVLNNIQIPGIVINPIDNSISLADQGKLELRLNGRPATALDIRGIEPQNIIRVEYHDNPSMRYGDASVVLDFIVRQPTTGGNLNLSLSQSVNRAWAEDYLGAKVNHKESEFGVSYWFSPRWNFKMWRDNTETYKYMDGQSFERVETGEPTKFSMYNHYVNLSYSLMKTDKMFLSIQPSLGIFRNPQMDFRGILTNTETKEQLHLDDLNSEKNLRPTLDTYFQYTLPNQQLIMFNLVGGYTNSNSARHYTERTVEENSAIISDYRTDISTDSYKMILEGDYEKTWKGSRITTGARYTQNWYTSEYKLTDVTSKMRQSEIYLSGDFWKRINEKCDFTLGLGVSTDCVYQMGANSTSSVIFRPKLSFRYSPGKQSTIRFEAYNFGNSPGINQLSDVSQQIDKLQVQVGNPALKSYQTFRGTISYEYAKGLFYGKLRGRYWGHFNPVMGEKFWSGDKIINTFSNQKNLQEINFDFQTRIDVIKDWLSISGSVGWHRYMSHGNDYTHTLNNWFYNGSIRLTHWGASLEGRINNNYKMLWGEDVSASENIHLISAAYNYKNVQFSVTIIDPFMSDYSIPSENLNQYAGYKRKMTTRGIQQLVIVGFSYNLSWGRKHQSAQKKINNELNNESIKAAGK